MKKRLIIIVGIIVIVLPLSIFFMDLFNISVSSITDKYDWIAFMGSYVAGIASLIIAYITVSQNEDLKKINKRMAEDNIKVNGYSEIMFNKDQDIEKIDDGYFLRLNLRDKNNRPLNKLIIEKISLSKYNANKNPLNPYDYLSELLAEKQEVKLEYTPGQATNQDFYLARIKVTNEILKIINDKYTKIEIKMSVINAFSLEESGIYSIIFNDIQDTEKFIKMHIYHTFAPNREINYIIK